LLPKRIYVLFIQESPPTPLSTLFPYTTLFRSRHSRQCLRRAGVGYHQPQEPPPAQGLRLSRVAERRLGVSPAAVRLGGGTERAYRLRHARRARHGESRSVARDPDLRRYRYRESP